MGQEDGDLPARQVLLYLLWQGEHEEEVRRHLAVLHQELPDQGRRGRLELHHHCRCLRQVCCEEVERDQGAVNRLPPSLHSPAPPSRHLDTTPVILYLPTRTPSCYWLLDTPRPSLTRTSSGCKPSRLQSTWRKCLKRKFSYFR